MIDLEWTRYHDRGCRTRVLQHARRGTTEYELISEGGQWLIRRTEHIGAHVVMTEAVRGRPAHVEGVWAALAISLSSPFGDDLSDLHQRDPKQDRRFGGTSVGVPRPVSDHGV